MSFNLAYPQPPEKAQDHTIIQITIPAQETNQDRPQPAQIDYSARSQWLRAAVLGTNDGLVSTALIMIGIGVANQSSKAMLVSGLAGLVTGALSMAIGEFVSIYASTTSKWPR